MIRPLAVVLILALAAALPAAVADNSVLLIRKVCFKPPFPEWVYQAQQSSGT